MALQRLAREDPSFRLRTDQGPGERLFPAWAAAPTVSSIAKREFKVRNVGATAVASRARAGFSRRQVRASVRQPWQYDTFGSR
jgi:hypothetical protein